MFMSSPQDGDNICEAQVPKRPDYLCEIPCPRMLARFERPDSLGNSQAVFARATRSPRTSTTIFSMRESRSLIEAIFVQLF